MNDSAPGSKDKRVNIKSRSGKKIVFECVTNVCTLYVNMQHKYETTRAQAKLQEHPKLHERKKNYKSTQNYMSAKKKRIYMSYKSSLKNRYLIRARTSNRRMHYMTKRVRYDDVLLSAGRKYKKSTHSLFCTSALTVRPGLTCRGDVT